MLKPLSTLLILMISAVSAISQESIKIENVCSAFNGQTVSASEADQVSKDLVNEVIKLTGQNFSIEILSTDQIDNIAAVKNENGQFLLLKKGWISEQGKNLNAVISICQQLYTFCAGEELDNQWTCEEKAIEADRFAGHILNQMDATIEEAKSAMNQTVANHSLRVNPSTQERLNAVTDGWQATQAIAETDSAYATAEPFQVSDGPDVSNPKSLRTNKHLILKRTGYPILQESWSSGFKVKESIYANGQWHVVMTPKDSDFKSQAMRLRAKWPENDIKDFWKDKHDISRIDYYNDVWFLCMTKKTNSVLQRWRTRLEFPEKEIKKGWDQGYHINDISYGEGLYALVLDKKPSEYNTQTWFRRTQFPEKEINEHWAKGHEITILKYLNGEWILVMTKYSDSPEQRWFTSNSFPSDIIREQEQEGYSVKCLNFGPDQWTLVVEQPR